jgi:hypothetical protein
MPDESTKKLVLARRARFIAAAIASAGLGVACGKDQKADAGASSGSGTAIVADAGADVTARPVACLRPPCRCEKGDPLCSCL